MRKWFLLFLAGCTLTAGGQTKEGKVVYERVLQLGQFRPPGMPEDMARNLPRSRTMQFELLFTPQQSLRQLIPDMEEENGNEVRGAGPGGERFVMRFGGAGADDIIFHDFGKGRRVDQRELFSKTYIVEDSIRRLSWKLSEETKKVLNYTVRKATAQRIGTRPVMTMENGQMKREMQADTVPIVAWFTTEIPVPAGPDLQGQLPGLILELDLNNGRDVYRAVELSPKVNAANVKEPKGGKRLSEEEFNQEREKAFEEMRRNAPPGSRIRIGG